jgi:hypothetical protein
LLSGLLFKLIFLAKKDKFFNIATLSGQFQVDMRCKQDNEYSRNSFQNLCTISNRKNVFEQVLQKEQAVNLVQENEAARIGDDGAIGSQHR